ncbi:MAG: redox-sensing transcriptional repressor Rex [Longimicrobiales bacterium]
MSLKRVSASTVERLSLYLRLLREVEASGTETVSSRELAWRGGTTAAQVRKDLSVFGTFGKRGLGYSVPELRAKLTSILGLERRWPVAVIGAGKIGSALLGYADFRRQGFQIEAVFDTDPAKVGRRWEGGEVSGMDALERIVRERGIEIAILAVPASAAQEVLERAVAAGIRGILNFAPTKLEVTGDVTLKNVNMAVELEGLSYALSRNGEHEGGD